ncbi:carboxymuconolactone decarboxylase family protein [Paraburkholderia sp. BCC1884]|uniref:carboxymuconolactone decarboxylase family protein n=1 Tax=Paraburkholderia sp. BCC1884 TaxID=2562668 RepID=UPI001C91F338|nr:carboxymuconolactone decarboxylase family protein [Paraburkholderia sp. BCC1884]
MPAGQGEEGVGKLNLLKLGFPMDRINLVTDNRATEEQASLLSGLADAQGKTPNIFKVLANSPAALRGYMGLRKITNSGKLNSATRTRIALAVSQKNESEYCIASCIADGKKIGLTGHEITRARSGTSEEARAAIAVRFANLLLETGGAVADDELRRLRWAGYGDAEIVEIIAHVAMNFFSNLITNVSEIEPDVEKTDTGSIRWQGFADDASTHTAPGDKGDNGSRVCLTAKASPEGMGRHAGDITTRD